MLIFYLPDLWLMHYDRIDRAAPLTALMPFEAPPGDIYGHGIFEGDLP